MEYILEMLKKSFCIFLLLVVGIPLFAQTGGEKRPGESLTVKIAVMGPGDELYFWWGHIALVIVDNETGRTRFYDYGVFSFESENFLWNFAFGRLLYSCRATPASSNIAAYVNTNRDVRLYTLDLPPETREAVRDFAENNVLPENRNYWYHNFKDNCSTRIRDIIDLATDGAFKEAYGNAPGRLTLRGHVRRHTWFNPFADWILNFWMGQDIDLPLAVWQEMFLPAEVGVRACEFYFTAADGVTRKLVSGEEIIYEAEGRHGVLDVPRRQWPRELAFSLCMSLLVGFFFFLNFRGLRSGQILIGASHCVCGFVFGVAGLLLFFMSFFTNHDYTNQNANLLFGNPLLFAAIPLGIRYAMAKTWNERMFFDFLLRALWALTALGIFLSMAIKITPWFWQQNLTDQMLMLPLALIFSLEPTGLRESLGRVFWRWM
jgi:hypothetical protein